MLDSDAYSPELVCFLDVSDAFVLFMVECVAEVGVLEDQFGGTTAGRVRGATAELGEGRHAFQDKPMGFSVLDTFYYYCHDGCSKTRGSRILQQFIFLFHLPVCFYFANEANRDALPG